MTMALLKVHNLHISFQGREVVHGVSFEIQAGEKFALVGESGSGKTVIALSLLGLARGAWVRGQSLFEGQDLLHMSDDELHAIRGSDIAMVFQEPMTALNPLFTIGDQISEVLIIKKGLNPKEAYARAITLLADTGIAEPERRVDSYPHQLSGGQRQRAMIAMALAGEPKLLLADEPTTALDVSMRGQILGLLSRLQHQHGMAVLLITHDLNMVRRFADRVVVMENGLVVEQGPVPDVLSRPQHAYTRRLVDSQPERNVFEPVDSARECIQARGLRITYPVARPGIRGWFQRGQFVALQGADFSLYDGQTLGIIGESGSGKSSLALAVLGLVPCQGELQIEGQSWQGNAKTDLPLRRALQVVFQDPFSSLSPRMNVEQLVGEGLQVHAPDLNPVARQSKVREALAEVGMNEEQFPGLLSRYPHEFSGGQRQRLAIARALIVQPRILVLDEPTSALDVSIQKQVLDLLQRLQRERGLSYLLITHDIEVIQAMAHHVLVLKDGVVVDAGRLDQVLERPQSEYTRSLLTAAFEAERPALA
ncbi:MAG: ABC transporter ATP-binding protein [Betaproteobacteria bacterium]|nr:ABC transporter ATP-binding protein [Betaproteobacteria bacterium]